MSTARGLALARRMPYNGRKRRKGKAGEAKAHLERLLSRLDGNVREVAVIHGYSGGTVLRDMVRGSLKHPRIRAKVVGLNPGVTLLILIPLQNAVMPQVTIPKFILMMALITVVFNGIFLLVFGRSREFKYLWRMGKGRLSCLLSK